MNTIVIPTDVKVRFIVAPKHALGACSTRCVLAAVNFNCDLRYNKIMPQLTKTEKLAAIEAALDHVFTDVDALVKQCAGEFAITNMGQSLEDWFPSFGDRP